MNAPENILQLLQLPSEFGILLLSFSLILALAPYLSGYDFGVIKIPDFNFKTKKCLKLIGPLSLLLVIGLHLNYKVLWTPTNKPIRSTMYTVHMYNIDDIAELYINGKPSYKVKWGYQGYEPSWFPFPEYGANPINSKPGDSQDINITSDLKPGDNELRFTLWDEGIYPGAAALSISVKKNGKEIIKESFSIPHYTIYKKPGMVYDKTFHILY